MPLNVNYKLLFCSLLLFQALPSDAETFFTDVTAELGVPLFDSRSLAIGDFDNDGWPDLFAAENRIIGRVSLLRNEGDGSFSSHNARIRTHIPDSHKGGGSIFGDIDNDGDQDLFMAIGSDDKDEGDRNLLLRNDRGVFVAAQAGLLDSLSTDSAIWMDYDRDGFIDLYTANPLERNILYRNNGDGSFTDQTAAAGLDLRFHPENGGSTDGLVAADFDNDGWSDLYIGNFLAPNRLFLNNRQGGFRDATTDEIGDEGEAFGVAVGDIDNDGDLDIFQASGGGSVEVPFRSIMLLNLGAGEFLDVTENLGLGVLREINAANPGLADIDNDGDLDLVIAHSERRLFLNDGSGRFEEATEVSGIVPKRRRAGYLSFGDYNLDGFVDIWTENGLSRNNGNSNHFLRVELVGVESNRNAIGARVWATSGDLAQMREILGGTGYNQDEMVAHFGLGAGTGVDRLEVSWPSGQKTVLEGVPADQKIRVIEGRPGYKTVKPAVWERISHSLLAAGSTVEFTAAVRPALFDAESSITRVTADLSAVGGFEEVDLTPGVDGAYLLKTMVDPSGANGLRQVDIRAEQATSLGKYWTALSQNVTVAPATDLGLADEWTLERQRIVNLSRNDAVDVLTAWSSDGRQALFYTRRDGRWQVYQMDADGSNPVNLSNNSANDSFPSWSPDGRQILFYTHRDGNNEIYLMNADGSDPVNLTNNPANDRQASWSPDGNQIVFESDRDGNSEIYVMNADGSNLSNLTDDESSDRDPSWSPGGKQIAFSSTRDGPRDIYVADEDGSNLRQLTDHSEFHGLPFWSPDGQRMTFTSTRDLTVWAELYMVNPDGAELVRLTHNPNWDGAGIWAPGGRKVAFLSYRTGNGDIYLLDLESDQVILNPDERGVVFEGQTALEVEASGEGLWKILYRAVERLDLVGYKALRFAFHPGDTQALDDPELAVTIGDGRVDLLNAASEGGRINLDQRDWQVVELPLSAFDVKTTMDGVVFSGNLTGTFYLDDVRLLTVIETARPTAVEEEESATPAIFALDQNYPNPFNSGTVIRFELPEAGETKLTVYNLVGQKVATLVEGVREAGSYTLRWDGRDDRGRSLASGVYIYRMQSGNDVETRKLLLLR